jgi:hypothetical protein
VHCRIVSRVGRYSEVHNFSLKAKFGSVAVRPRP